MTNMHRISRRTWLAAAAAALSTGLTGCSCPGPRRPVSSTLEPTGAQPLAPVSFARKDLPLAFDVHTHLFNATDVHVAGYLSISMAHSVENEKVRSLIKAAAPVVEAIGQTLAISCGDEMEALRSLVGRQQALNLAPAAAAGELDQEVDQQLDRFVEELHKRLPGSELGRLIDAEDLQFRLLPRAAGAKLEGRPPLSRDAERLKSAVTTRSEREASPRAKALAEQGVDSIVAGVLRFVRFMCSPRHHNLRAYIRSYTEDSGAFGIDACFSALVDFDRWLGCERTPSSLRDQMLVHEQLAVLSGGFVLPLIPYNPWTDIEEQGASLRLVKEAIGERGFVGVKIYPPMGFGPDGRVIASSSRLPRPKDPAAVWSALQRLYKYCRDAGVPVMGHTSHSLGRDSDHDELGGPDGWRKPLQEFDGLHINAGHFGGGYFNEQEKIYWPMGFAKLMSEFSGVYGDLGYADELVEANSPAARRLADTLITKLSSGQPAFSHVMYGSDWLMMSKMEGWERFPQAISAFLGTLPSQDAAAVRQAAFGRAAIDCYGLGKGHRNRQRLETFYAKWQVPAPRWIAAVDAVTNHKH